MAHDPDWGSYFCRINGALSSVAVDMGLLGSEALAARPVLVYVHVDLHDPSEDGLSTEQEAPRLFDFEERLVDALGEALDAVQTGRVTGVGRRELYFHAASADGLDAAIEPVHAQFADYALEAGSHDDPGAEHYRRVLWPTPLERHFMLNRQVLQRLLERGDDLRRERPVDHLLRFDDADARDAFASLAEQAGFTVTARTAGRGGPELRLQRVQAVLPGAIDDVTAWLVQQTATIGGEYDGWGCPIARADEE